MTSKSPVIIDLKFAPEEVAYSLKHAFAGREIINLADPAHKGRDLSGIDYAVVWKQDADLFDRAKDIKVIFSGGAGVDHILGSGRLPDVPLVRFVDETLTNRMSEWVVLQCLLHLRQQSIFDAQKKKHIWHYPEQPKASDITVGIMGLGVLGQDSARKLSTLGFNVIGWSRTPKTVDGVETFAGDALDEFLGETDFLVGLLPLTAETRGIFNASLFGKLSRKGPFKAPVFINAGRGGSQAEADIVAALRSGTLHAASLDVFEKEPLDPQSPLWDLDNLFITPHSAAHSEVRALFAHIEHQIDRLESGKPLEHLVDRKSGY